MDPATRRNLELTETLRGEASPTLFSLLDECATGMGSRLLRHWLHHPLRDRERHRRATKRWRTLIDTNACLDCRRHCATSPTWSASRRASRWSARPSDLSGCATAWRTAAGASPG
jgi:DNA mismatch repair protein MutS